MVLGIYGAGGLGREVLELALTIDKKTSRWNEIVFVDDKPEVGSVRDRRVVSWKEFKKAFLPESSEVAIAVGEPFTRKYLRNLVIGDGYNLAILIHPSTQIASDCEISQGAIIHYNTLVSSGVRLDENVYLQPSCVIGHDAQIGMDSVISTFVVVAGSCFIGEQAYIGLGASIKEQIKVGNGAIVGMGSVVMKNVAEEMVTLGNPARPIRHNEEHRVFG